MLTLDFVLSKYCPEICEALISPSTDVAISRAQYFSAWEQHANCDTGMGCICFIHCNGMDHTKYPLTICNGLWYYNTLSSLASHTSERIHHLTKAAEYELWHQRLAHPGIA